MKNLLIVLETLLYRHSRKVLVALLVICAAVISGIQYFKLDASSDSLVLEKDQALEYYRQIIRRYGSDSFLFITYTPEADLFSPAQLGRLSDLQEELAAIPRVASVMSILNVPLLQSPPISFEELSKGIRTLQTTGVDISLAREELRTSPLYSNLLLSEDARTTALMVNFERDEHFYELLYARDDLRDKKHREGLSAEEKQQLRQANQAFRDYNAQVAERTAREIATVREIMDRHRDGVRMHLGGIPMITADMISFIKSDLETFGVGVMLFLITMLWLFFHRFRWVLIPMAACVISALFMMGLLGWLDWRVTVISSNFVSLLLVITMSLTIHLVVRYRELHAEHPDWSQQQLVSGTLRHMFKPCLYTALTTIVAFMSLIVSGIRPVIDFGWMMAIGISVAFVFVFVLFPVILVQLKKQPPRPVEDLTRSFTLSLASLTDRRTLPVLLFYLLLGIAGIVGIQRLTVDNRFIDYFQEDTEIYQGMLEIDRRLGGTTPLDVIIDAPAEHFAGNGVAAENDPFADDLSGSSSSNSDAGEDPFADTYGGQESEPKAADPFADDAFADDPFADDPFADTETVSENGHAAKRDLSASYFFNPWQLQKLEKIQAYLESLPETGKVLSLATTNQLATLLNGGKPLSFVNLMLLDSFLSPELRKILIEPYMAEDGNQVRFNVRLMESDPNMRRQALLDKIHSDLVSQFSLQPEQVHLTGMAVLYNNMLQSLFNSQIKTLGAVFLGIVLMFIVLFRSVSLALIGIVPNLLSASVVLGVMGWIGLPLDMMTITIAAITIGIAVDDTIHYIMRFKKEFQQNNDYRQVMRLCHGSIGKAMYYTSVTIIVGFSILALSNFNPTIYFGLLTGLAMLIAMFANLTLLPALLLLVKPRVPA